MSCPFADDFLVLLMTPPPPLVLPELKMDFQALVVLLLLAPPPDPLEPELEEPEEELQPLLLEVARGFCKVWLTNTISYLNCITTYFVIGSVSRKVSKHFTLGDQVGQNCQDGENALP